MGAIKNRPHMVETGNDIELCDMCLAMFKPNKPWQRYCSKACSDKGLSIEWRYGISMSRYWELLSAQDFKCAVPGCESTELTVDHDHDCCPKPARSCGKCVRGLLCGSHNKTLGFIGDDPHTLIALAEYLTRHKEK